MGLNMPAVNNNQAPANVSPMWTAEDKALIQETVAKGTTDSEFKLFLYTAMKYGLDPLVKQVWCVKYGNNPASIFTGRDGFLSIAHRSGKFDGMESGTKTEGSEIIGWCRVYRTDMTHPFYVEVRLSEYTTGKNLWQTKPHTMIQKVAESQCLRRAFDITGLYSPEEFDQGYQSETQQINQTPTNKPSTSNKDVISKAQAKRMFAIGKGHEDIIRSILQEYGYEHSTDIKKSDYENICKDIEAELESAKDINDDEQSDEPQEGKVILPEDQEHLPWDEEEAN